MPLAWKLAAAITALIVVGMGLLGALIIRDQTELLRNQLDQFGQTLAQQFAKSVTETLLAGDRLSLGTQINNLQRSPQLSGAAVFTEAGELAASAGALPASNLRALGLRDGSGGGTIKPLRWLWHDPQTGLNEVVSFVEPVEFQGVTAGHVLITYSMRSTIEALELTRQSVLGATVLMVVFAVILAILLSRRLTRPVQDLVIASHAIRRGEYDHRIGDQRGDELGTLIESFNHMAQGLEEKLQVESALSRYVSPGVASQILHNLDRIELGGYKTRGTVLFADMVGFTNMAEKLHPEQVGELLNEYFSYITAVSRYYRGTVDKFIGDCAMVVFGVLENDPDHSFHAIACAVMIQRLVERLNQRRTGKGRLPVHFRIGLNSGEMLAGNMGSQERMQFTVVGDTVNLASRLAAEAEAGDILITEELYSQPRVLARVRARRRGTLQLRGIHKPVQTCVVDDLEDSERLMLQTYVDELLVERYSA